jgi:hypothetical protein
MKTIAKIASLVALGAVSLQAADGDSKIWSVSANLRGFYDDNIATTPSGAVGPTGIRLRQSSLGFEVSPSISIDVPLDETKIGFSYTYGMKYYENRSNSADHSHQADLKVSHAFTPRYKLAGTDSFVVAQEASLIDPSVPTTALRSNGNNMRNIAGLSFTAECTPLLGFEVGYQNSFYDYQQTGLGSRSALLDRIENLGRLDLRWQALPTTVGILGYQFNMVDQTSKDFLVGTTLPSTRDNHSHYLYVGADHDFNSQLKGSIRAGGQYTEYPNAVAPLRKSSVSPYADANISYAYAEGSTVQVGVKHTRNQTDIGNTLDQESTTAYGELKHKITAKFTGSLIGQYQRGTFNQGPFNNQVDNMFLAGVNLAYEINPHLTAETGYNYDRLDSDLAGRSFTRNRVFLGIRASY